MKPLVQPHPLHPGAPMRVRALTLGSVAFLFAILLVLPSLAWAGWFMNGNAACRAPGEQVDVSIVPDGSGGSFVVWRDLRRAVGLSDLYATRLLADGTRAAGWPVEGLPLSQSGAVGRPWAVASGDGGLMVFWVDSQTFAKHMQRVDGAGVIAAGFPVDGMLLPIPAGGAPGGVQFQAVGDGAGGAYLMWTAAPFFNSQQLRLTRVSGTGAPAPGFSYDGLEIGHNAFSFGRPWVHLRLVSDPTGGAWISEIAQSEDEPRGSSDLGFQQKVNGDGSRGRDLRLVPDGHDGTPDGHAFVNRMAGAPDGSGGALVAWRIGGPLGPADFMRHYSSTGADLSSLAPAPVVDAAIADGTGGVYLFGAPLGSNRLELHRRGALGDTPAGWASGTVVSASGSYLAFELIRLGSRVLACWSSGAAGAQDLFAASVEADGTLTPGWTAGGLGVANAAGMQALAGALNAGGIAPGLDNDAFVAWQDTRSGGSDVYVARLGANGPIVDARIEAELTVAPRRVERLQHGHWFKAWIEPPAPYDAHSIDVASLLVNGSVAVAARSRIKFVDHDRDGIMELLVRFERDAVAATLPATGAPVVELTGTIAGLPFVAADTLLGDEHALVTPEAGMRLNPGTVTRLAWRLPEGMRSTPVAVLASLDAGRSWETIAAEIPAGSSLDWNVPNRRSDHVLIAIAMADPGETADQLMDGVLGVSPEFAIGSTLGVDGAGSPVALAIRCSTPNPQSSRSVRVDLALASDTPARIELVDLSGRTRCSEELNGLAAGTHSVILAARGGLPSGIYFARLRQGDKSVTLRLTILD